MISSESVCLSDILLAPSNSLVQLSRDASFHPGYPDLNNAVMNGDGFGVGWYHTTESICRSSEVSYDGSSGTMSYSKLRQTGTSAAVFRDIYPAWNNTNLHEICISTKSSCIMAHVRAASKGTGISQQNCHPFKAGRLLFCHNGRMWNFKSYRRRFLALLSDEAFSGVRGTTDSEAMFGLILTYLAKDGQGSPYTQKEPFGHERLARALKKALRQVEIVMEENNIMDGYSTFNFSITDGDTMVATRFCDKDIPPPSLYFAFGDSEELYSELTADEPQLTPKTSSIGSQLSDEKKSDDTASQDSDENYDLQVVDIEEKESKQGTVLMDVNPATASFIVCSNPLTTKTHTWHKMPRNSIMWYTRGKHPELRLLKRRKQRYTVS
jgi:glutamine amidotransferase